MNMLRRPGNATPDTRPWSPLALTLLSLVFGLGAVVMSVRNLQQLGVIEGGVARFYFWGTTILLASVLLLIWSLNPHAFDHSPESQLAPLSVASPIAVFLMQIVSFQRWKAAHPAEKTKPWFTAIIPVIIMTFVTALVAVFAIEIFGAIFSRQ